MTTPSIQYFPSIVLSKIFSYVEDEDLCNKIPFVCEKWKIVSSLLPMRNASFKGTLISSNDICYRLHNAIHLKSIALDSVDDVVPVLRQLCRSNKQVEKIILNNCSSERSLVPEETLINLLLCLPELQSIGLKRTKFESDMFYEQVGRHANITGIDISSNEFVTLKNLMTLIHNSKIQEFKMSRRFKQPRITDKEMAHLIKTMRQQLVLLHLDMSGLGNYTYNEIFCCSGLTDLKLNNAMNLSAELLTTMRDSLPKIRHLKIEGPSLLTPGDLYKHFFEDSTTALQLDSLQLENFDTLNNSECSDIIKICSNLKTLSLKGCRSLTLEGVQAPLQQLDDLHCLNIGYVGESTRVRDVIPCLPQLKVLIIDQASHELNNLSTLMEKQLQIIQLKRK